jgi:hypothetical protein
VPEATDTTPAMVVRVPLGDLCVKLFHAMIAGIDINRMPTATRIPIIFFISSHRDYCL